MNNNGTYGRRSGQRPQQNNNSSRQHDPRSGMNNNGTYGRSGQHPQHNNNRSNNYYCDPRDSEFGMNSSEARAPSGQFPQHNGNTDYCDTKDSESDNEEYPPQHSDNTEQNNFDDDDYDDFQDECSDEFDSRDDFEMNSNEHSAGQHPQYSNDRQNDETNNIKVTFHVHLPEKIEKWGQPIVIGSIKELGSWENPIINLYQPYTQNPTYWRSEQITIDPSHDILYKYALSVKGKIKLEGNGNRDNRTLDTTRNDQFGIWKSSRDLLTYLVAPEAIRDFAFVNYIYNSITANNLKDRIMTYQYLLMIHSEITVLHSDIKFVLNHMGRRETKESKLFLSLLLGYHIQRQNVAFEMSSRFSSELLLDAFDGYRQEALPSDTKGQIYTAIIALVKHNAFKMYFNWLKIFTIAAEVDPSYSFVDHLGALKYSDDNLLDKFIKEVKNIKSYIDVKNSEICVKLSKWLIQLCHNMDSLFKLWNEVLPRRIITDKRLLKYFSDQVQKNISCAGAVTLESQFKNRNFRNHDVSAVFRARVLSLLERPNNEWSRPNISAIQRLLQDSNLNWCSDDVLLSLELISQSRSFELLSVFPELLDGCWFRKNFSDTKKEIPDICVNWLMHLLAQLSSISRKSTSDKNFILSVFQQLENAHPLLGHKANLWSHLTNVVTARIKGCSEDDVLSATKSMAQIKHDEFKNMLLDMVKEILNKTAVQQINDQLIDKIFIFCDLDEETHNLKVPNSISEDILCHIMTRLPGQLAEPGSSEYHLNLVEASKFWNIILRATGSVKKLNSNPIVERAKSSINQLWESLLNGTIDKNLLQQMLTRSDEELFYYFDAAVPRTRSQGVSRKVITNARGICENFKLSYDILFKFYGRFCSAATDVDIYLQQMLNSEASEAVNLKRMDSPDYWAFHGKTLDIARRCYKYNQSQSFLNIFECCLKEDASATKVEYIAENLIPTVFGEYENLCEILLKGWEKLKCSDASVLWKGVKNVNAEIDLMTGFTCSRDKRFVQSLEYLSKIPQQIEKLEQLGLPHNPDIHNPDRP